MSATMYVLVQEVPIHNGTTRTVLLADVGFFTSEQAARDACAALRESYRAEYEAYVARSPHAADVLSFTVWLAVVTFPVKVVALAPGAAV